MKQDKEEVVSQYSCQSLTKLIIESVKQNDLKFIFQVLASPSQSRTIADLDHLVKIMMHIQPIKKLQSISAVYFLCKKMVLMKYKSKDIVYEDHQRADSLYIVLNGKVALFKKSTQIFDSDQVIFMNPGSCFGKFYNWKVSFIPISIEETLLAVAPKNEVNKIPIQLSYQQQTMIEELMNSDLFQNCEASPQEIQEASKLLILTRIPCGNFLIRQGQTPKALFHILKGIVKKIVCQDNKIIEVRRFYQGEHCPQMLKGTFKFELIAQTSCEIIVIPKKVLKIIKSPLLYGNSPQKASINLALQLYKKQEWRKYKQSYLSELVYKSVKKVQKNKQWK